MNVLGLFGYGTNPGACLLQDGELVAFAEEERFSRQKGSHGLFPGRAVASCLRQGGLRLGEVERIAFPWDTSKYPYRMGASLARQYLANRFRAGTSGAGGSTWLTVVSNLLKYTPGRLREDVRIALRAHGLKEAPPPIEFVPHHLAHAYSAYFCSPFDEAVVLTLDGSGEELCTQIAVGRGERLEARSSIPVPNSLGWYYAAFTAYFGFQPYRHEGKLMALAALGHARAQGNPWPERLQEVLRVDEGGYSVDPLYTRFGEHTYAERFTDSLARWVTRHDRRLEPLVAHERGGATGDPRYLEPAYVDLAWGVQRKLEEAAGAVARAAAREHRSKNLCLAGGVAQNCKLNGSLLAETPFERLFVQPACYDAGTAIGAAMVVAEAHGDPIRNALEHAYYGPSWTQDEIGATLADCRLSAERCDDVAARAAEELAAGKRVGWFQGGMELGPRALGARSILASPLAPDVARRLNVEVKSREPWRPFGPSLLGEAAGDYLELAASAPFMTTGFRVREERREELAPVMHVDGTTRPQTVTAEGAPLYHRLLTEFRARTGSPLLLNTSFNGPEEPIVCAPIEAIRCFYSTGLDALALGDYLLRK